MLKYIENKHLYQFRLESSYVGIKVVWNWMSIGVKLIYFFRFQSPLIPHLLSCPHPSLVVKGNLDVPSCALPYPYPSSQNRM